MRQAKLPNAKTGCTGVSMSAGNLCNRTISCRSSVRFHAMWPHAAGHQTSMSSYKPSKDDLLSRARQYYEEVWTNGKVLLLDQLMAEEHEQHDCIWQPDRIGSGRRLMKRGILAYRIAYPDLSFNVIKCCCCLESLDVFVEWQAAGTNLGPIRDQPPTYKKVRFSGVTKLTFNNTGMIQKSYVYRQTPDEERTHFQNQGLQVKNP